MSGRDDEGKLSRGEFVKTASGVIAGLGVLGLAACGGGEGESADTVGGDTTQATAGGATTATTSTSEEAKKSGGVLQFAVGDANNKDTLDPGHSEDTNTFVLAGNVYERLVQVDSDDHTWEPVLAESLEPSTDFTQWTIKLRDGITFHDGRPLTAKDVAFTLGRIVDEEYGNDVYAALAPSLPADGIQVQDELTLVLNLARPDPIIPHALGRRQAAIVPEGFPTDTTDPSSAIGSGPFRAKSFAAGEGWELERNPDYWQPDKVPLLDGIRAVTIGEQATKLQSVLSGESHLTDGISASLAATIDESVAKIANLNNGAYLVVTMDQTQEPFTDSRVVTALKHAVDRERLLQVVQFGFGSVAYDVPVPVSDFFYPEGYQVSYDPAQARQLLAEAGYPDGIDLEIITSDVFAGFVDLAVAFAEMAKDAGFRINVKQWPPGTYWDQVWLKKPMYLDFWTRLHPSQKLSVTYSASSRINASKYDNPRVDELVDQAGTTGDREEQQRLYGEALELVAVESANVIPFFVDRLWVAKPSVEGLKLDIQLGVLFNEAWLAT